MDQARISVFDSGLSFGDGVFEGLRVYEGRVFKLSEHVKRLYASARSVCLAIPMTPEDMEEEITTWLRRNELREEIHFRPIVTRGYRYPPRVDPRNAEGRPNIVFLAAPAASHSNQPISLVTTSRRRVPAQALDPKIKSLSFLPQVLAKQEALQRGADDALVLDMEGCLAESSTANVFLVKDGSIYTPWTKACLEGITRSTVMRLAHKRGYKVVEKDLTLADAYGADEVFLTGTGLEIAGVWKIDEYQIGEDTPGPVTRFLVETYQQLVRREGTQIEPGT